MFNKKVACIGDIHEPYSSESAKRKVLEIVSQFKPDLIIQEGDLYDQFSFSKYPKSLNAMKPKEEIELGREKAEFFWSRLRKASPRSKCVQLKGNHDERAEKRALEAQPALEHIITEYIDRLMTFDSVETIYDAREEFVYDGVLHMHGRSKFGDHALYNQMSTVCGHLHLGGVIWHTNIKKPYFEMNVGYIGDKNSTAFSYYAQKRISKTTNGMGLIDHLGPRFVCFD